MTTTFASLWRKLRDKQYREHLVEAQLKRGIPFQVRALLKKTGLSQEQLATRAGLTQGVISRAANPNYGNLTLTTIVRIAAGFDVAFIGRFVPFSDLDAWFDDLSEDRAGGVPTFEEEDLRFAEIMAGRFQSQTSTAPVLACGGPLKQRPVDFPYRLTSPPDGPSPRATHRLGEVLAFPLPDQYADPGMAVNQ